MRSIVNTILIGGTLLLGLVCSTPMLGEELRRTSKCSGLCAAVRDHPQSLVGYSVYDDTKPVPFEHAMVLDLTTCKPDCVSYMVFPKLPERARRQVDQFDSLFVGWLGDHKKAVIHVGNFNQKGADWTDDYIADFETGKFFSPTQRASPWPYTTLVPYSVSREGNGSAIGYLFTEQHPETFPYFAKLVEVHIDGTGRKEFDPLAGTTADEGDGKPKPVRVNTHGCTLPSNVRYMTCERSCRKSWKNYIPGFSQYDSVTGNSCFQLFEISSVNPFVNGRQIRLHGKVAIGGLWAPDGTGYAFYGVTDSGDVDSAQNLSVSFMRPDTHSYALGCKDDTCQPDAGDAPLGKYYHHSNSAPADKVQCDSELKGGSDVGQWGKGAFYFSVTRDSESLKFNQIGRVLVKLPPSKGEAYKFVQLTPKGLDARSPSPAPKGSSSIVFVGTKYWGTDPKTRQDICVSPGKRRKDDGPVQLLRLSKGGIQRLTHIPKGWVPTYPQWSEITSVALSTKDIPTDGVGAGHFQPAIWNGTDR